MASAVIDTIESFLSGSTAGGAIGRGILAGLISFGTVDLINHFVNTPKNSPSGAAGHPGTKYAIIDVHNNTTIAFISRKRVYRFLSKPKRRIRSVRIVVAPPTPLVRESVR